MKQIELQKIVLEKYNYIPDSLGQYSKIEDCIFYADKLSFQGYGQNANGYYGYNNVNNPSQKFHLATAYFQDKFDHNNTQEKLCDLEGIRCPQLILWVAEIVESDTKNIKEAYDYIVRAEDRVFKDGLNTKGKWGTVVYWKEMEKLDGGITEEEFKRLLNYSNICEIIKKENSWDDVVQLCKML